MTGRDKGATRDDAEPAPRGAPLTFYYRQLRANRHTRAEALRNLTARIESGQYEATPILPPGWHLELDPMDVLYVVWPDSRLDANQVFLCARDMFKAVPLSPGAQAGIDAMTFGKPLSASTQAALDAITSGTPAISSSEQSGREKVDTAVDHIATLYALNPPPADTEPPATPRAPKTKNVSEATLRQCLLDIVTNHPPDTPPLDEETLIGEVERRLNASVQRARVRQALKDVAPHFKLPQGRPRKHAQ